jgi:hypothetical protein
MCMRVMMQVGSGSTVNQLSPTLIMSSGVVDVSGGLAFTCALKTGSAYCWGSNMYGQVGFCLLCAYLCVYVRVCRH